MKNTLWLQPGGGGGGWVAGALYRVHHSFIPVIEELVFSNNMSHNEPNGNLSEDCVYCTVDWFVGPWSLNFFSMEI